MHDWPADPDEIPSPRLVAAWLILGTLPTERVPLGAERDGDLTDRQPLMLAVSRARAWRQTRLPLRSNWKAASASTAARVRLAVIE
jgi:hypothetical protein